MADVNGIQPVMNMGGSDGAWGCNGFMGLFGLLILLGIFNGGLGGWGGNGYNGNSNAIQNDINRGFDNQNLQAQTRDILSAVNAGTAQSVAATNATFHDNLGAMQSMYNETARDMAGLAVGQSNILANQNSCCGSTKMLIADAGASLSAQIAQNKYENAMQMAGMEARIMQKFDANEITSLRDKVSELQMAQATAGVLRFPNQWSYGAGPFPPIFGCCGQDNI